MADYQIVVPEEEKLTCRICSKVFDNKNSLGGHIGIGHKMLYEHYLVKYYNNDVRPPCAECGNPTRYDRRTGLFKKYCIDHSDMARAEWSKENGYGAKLDAGWKRGLSKDNNEVIRKHSERMMGENNPMHKNNIRNKDK